MSPVSVGLDLSIVAVIAFFCFFSYKNGFAREIVKLASIAVSLVVSLSFSEPCAKLLYEKVLEQRVETSISDNLAKIESETIDASDAQETFDNVLSAVPDALRGITGLNNVDIKKEIGDNLVTRKNLTDYICNLIKTPIINILSLVCFLLIMMIVSRLLSLISRSLRIVNRIPIVGRINSILGLVMGIVHSAVFILCATAICSFLIGDGLPISKECADKTILFGYLTEHNPILEMLNF